tara:strand:- start:2 stop:265 length:264 start_codon:yes stop_codon:yes gene_type:complete
MMILDYGSLQICILIIQLKHLIKRYEPHKHKSRIEGKWENTRRLNKRWKGWLCILPSSKKNNYFSEINGTFDPFSKDIYHCKLELKL